MMRDLLARGVVKETDRCGVPFRCPITRGMEDKAAKGWIENVLRSDTVMEEEGTG
jgi:hypothetical protein